MDQFSSDFASHWDELVGWEKRSEADISFLLSLMQRFNCRSVLDVALGTGFHSIQLLRAGLRVKSVDISQAMIDMAKKNADRHSVELDVLKSDWVRLGENVTEKFDCILCLGNSLACEMSSAKRQEAVSNWSQLLTENGVIVIDRRNYESLLAGEYNFNSKGQYFGETVKIAMSKLATDETVFSYTFADGRTFDLNMYPILDRQMRSIFSQVGFSPVEVFGDREVAQEGRDVAFYLYVFKRIKND